MESIRLQVNPCAPAQTQKAGSQGLYSARWWPVVPLALLSGLARAIADPTVGAHALSYFPPPSSQGPLLSTAPMDTEAYGSTMLVWVGRGNLNNFSLATVPLDTQGNSYDLLGPVQSYAPKWPNSGEVLYAASSVVGGTGHVVSAPRPVYEEVTMVAVEVKNGGLIQDVQSSVLLSSPITSPTVTTTGPATLVAIWAGDGGIANSATPDNGFTIVEQLFALETPYIQVAVATKNVAEAGSYNVTWDASPWQGAHLWLVAVQSLPVSPPLLSVRPSGEHLIISWPAAAGGYILEMSSQPSVAAAWTSVTNAPVILDGRNTITNKIAPESLFYRLKK